MKLFSNSKFINYLKSFLQKNILKIDKQHILDNPDTYIGSIENINSKTFIR